MLDNAQVYGLSVGFLGPGFAQDYILGQGTYVCGSGQGEVMYSCQAAGDEQ